MSVIEDRASVRRHVRPEIGFGGFSAGTPGDPFAEWISLQLSPRAWHEDRRSDGS
jgi:hypothetical protein